MKIVMNYYEHEWPHELLMYIHHAPHKRQHRAMIGDYRNAITAQARRQGIKYPITEPIHLNVHFVDPTTPDLDHLLEALYMALDGKTKFVNARYPGLLENDSQIHSVEMSKSYPCEKTASENR